MNNLLSHINSPKDLKALNKQELVLLAGELRQFIIDEISHNPGHLGSSLGTIELSIALHYVYNTPYDRIVWDVGHQAYPHKILTGRRDQFHTNRTFGGLSGFPSIFESEYDAFGTGHSSTSISAALGMALASRLKGEKDRQHIAVIGDGSMTGGMAFEGLNNAGFTKSNVLVILNDNGISIDKSAGALSAYFTKISSSSSYNQFKNKVWRMFGKDSDSKKDPRIFIKNLLGASKSLIFSQSNLFEALNFRYFGPIDGHNIEDLSKILNSLKKIDGPKLLHIVTVKGKGLSTAESAPTVFHAPGNFDPETGELIASGINLSLAPKYQDVFGKTILELAQANPKIIGITPAMPSGCSLNFMIKKMPERVFDVGIAEQHAVTFAAGLAHESLIPFCNIYSSFMQRAYDQVIHDVALQKLNVILCLDRAGLVGEDGATHQGIFDLAYLRPIPNLIISAPMNESELRSLMFTAQSSPKGAFVIRYPRGRGVIPRWKTPFEELPIGKGRRIIQGKKIAFISIGHPGNFALKAIEKYNKEHQIQQDQGPSLYNMIFLKPLDTELLHEVFQNHEIVFTLEDGVICGGLGSAVCEFAIEHQYTQKIHRLGVPDKFIPHGKPAELHKLCGYDSDSLYDLIIKNA